MFGRKKIDRPIDPLLPFGLRRRCAGKCQGMIALFDSVGGSGEGGF